MAKRRCFVAKLNNLQNNAPWALIHIAHVGSCMSMLVMLFFLFPRTKRSKKAMQHEEKNKEQKKKKEKSLEFTQHTCTSTMALCYMALWQTAIAIRFPKSEIFFDFFFIR